MRLLSFFRIILAAGVFVGTVGAPVVAHAQTDPGTAVSGSTAVVTIPPSEPPTEVAGVTITREDPTNTAGSDVVVMGSAQSQVLGQVAEADGNLAFTGSDLVGLSAIATGAVVLGAGILLARNRRRRIDA